MNRSLTKRLRLGILIAVAVIAGGAVARAVIPDTNGVIHGCYAKKDGTLRVIDTGAGGSCSSKTENSVSWNQAGEQGPPGSPGPKGDKGDPGPVLTSLNGVPCDTGSTDKPNGAISVSVSGSGVMTLTCASSNPVLTVSQANGPLTSSCTILGCLDFYFRYDVQEVDGSGNPVSGGFVCTSTRDQNPLGHLCQTQRFASGATVRLSPTADSLTAGTPLGQVPSWTGCGSVSGNTCTVTMSGDTQVTITPVASS